MLNLSVHILAVKYHCAITELSPLTLEGALLLLPSE